MRPAVPLYQFMPYGAPELLESRQRHMSRALVVTSLAALALYALTRAVAALIPDAQVPAPVPKTIFEQQEIEILRPLLDLALPKMPPAPTSVVHPAAEPVSVPDEIAKPSEVPGPVAATAVETGTGVAIAPTETSGEGMVAETLPEFGTWVYVEHLPKPVIEVKPDYPRIAIDARVEGRVTVHALVGKDGRVLDARLSKIQVPMLNDAALDAARKWVFTPGIANGHPVACWTAIPFNFRLH